MRNVQRARKSRAMATLTAETNTAPALAKTFDDASASHDSGSLRPIPSGFLRERVTTVPNLVTAVRTLVAVTVGGAAIAWSAPSLLAFAYGIYWLGDMLDGFVARRLRQETRLGAVFDIISDRACTSILCSGIIAIFPHLAIVAIPFFLSFMVLDTILSLAFLCWPILSPNYFWHVDRWVYRLNWAPPAKALNTAGVVILVVIDLPWAALSLIALICCAKVWSTARVATLIHRATGPLE